MNTFDMKEHDREEQLIHNAFSRINVDTTELSEGIKIKMSRPAKRVRRNFSAAAAAILVILAISGTAYAAAGGLDGFIARFNPPFGGLSLALEEPVYVDSQGIRMTVYGAQQFGNVVLVHLTIQDISGENRLTRYMWPDLEIYIDNQPASRGAGSSRMLHFDRSNNKAYFEARIIGKPGIPQADNLEIVGNSIRCTQFSGQVQTPVRYAEWRITVQPSDTTGQVLTWTDIPAGDIHIEYMSLSPLGIQMTGTFEWNLYTSWPSPSISIETDSPWRNVRITGSGGGIGFDDFDMFFYVDSPVDIETVTAVIVNGVRIPAE